MHCSGVPHIPTSPPEPTVGKYRQGVGVSMRGDGVPVPWQGAQTHCGHTPGVPKVPIVKGDSAVGTRQSPSHRGGSGCGVTQACRTESVSVGQEDGVGSADGQTDVGPIATMQPSPTAGRCPYIMDSSGSGPTIGQRIFTVGGEQTLRRDNLIAGWGSVVLTLFFFPPSSFFFFSSYLAQFCFLGR